MSEDEFPPSLNEMAWDLVQQAIMPPTICALSPSKWRAEPVSSTSGSKLPGRWRRVWLWRKSACQTG